MWQKTPYSKGLTLYVSKLLEKLQQLIIVAALIALCDATYNHSQRSTSSIIYVELVTRKQANKLDK